MKNLQQMKSSEVTSTHVEDADVFQAMRSGSLSALETLYQRYGEAVYRLALRMLGNIQEAEDITQDIFVELWQKSSYDPTRGSMIVFLLTMTRSRVLNRLKRNHAHKVRLTQWLKEPQTSSRDTPFENASLEELSVQVTNALKALPDSQRLVLEMAYYDGLSQSEITKRLNIPIGTVKSQSRRSLLKLRKLLQDWMN
ncbi:MAG: sigma-70 family RNA polymerase sigma factor [Leptolyngbyaceae cyanobacterium]